MERKTATLALKYYIGIAMIVVVVVMNMLLAMRYYDISKIKLNDFFYWQVISTPKR